jgi:hypothetical protein
MKTGKKIAVCLAAALVVAMFAAGAVSMVGAQDPPVPVNYTVTVSSGIDVTIDVLGTNFGEMLPGYVRLVQGFTLTNYGLVDARVDAAFTTKEGVTHGFTGGSVIPAENFMINDVALNNDGSDKRVTDVEVDKSVDYNAQLSVPAEQELGVYNGTVELTFSPII